MIGAFDQGRPDLRNSSVRRHGWVDQLKAAAGRGLHTSNKPIPPVSITGLGCTEAPRGALMHHVHHNTARSRRTSASCRRRGTARRRTPLGRGAIEQAIIVPRSHDGTTPDASVRRRLRQHRIGRWRRGPAYRPVLRPVHRMRGTLETGGERFEETLLSFFSLFALSSSSAAWRTRTSVRTADTRRHRLLRRLSPGSHVVLDGDVDDGTATSTAPLLCSSLGGDDEEFCYACHGDAAPGASTNV